MTTAAWNKLLEAEINLRRQLESVAALRRRRRRQAEASQDYVFDETPAR